MHPKMRKDNDYRTNGTLNDRPHRSVRQSRPRQCRSAPRNACCYGHRHNPDRRLAVVETKRTFRNDEATTIEALLSLPVPVHAAFFGLTAKINGRILKGIAQAREEARETYEDAARGHGNGAVQGDSERTAYGATALCDVRTPTAHLTSIIVRTMVLSCACKRYTYKPLGKSPAPKRTV